MKSEIAENLERVRAQVVAACARASRAPNDVRLIAVSKTKPVELIREAMAAGQTSFGENYVQEAVDKISQIPGAEWHFIGSLQTNKAKQVAGRFAYIHSVDRLKLASALDVASAAKGVIQPILLQVHIGDEATKHGFLPVEAPDAIAEISTFKNLSVRGLMSLPPLEETESRARANFAQLRDWLENWRPLLAPNQRAGFKELSMGTSSDFEAAILEGATFVRVGTSIFGERV